MDIKIRDRKWTAAYTEMLLSLYTERQEQFRDPRRKVKDVWGEMVQLLTNEGMTDIDAVQLDRKFRNLKKTFFTIRNKHQERGADYQPNWKFYDRMAEILKDEAPPGTQVILDVDDYDYANPLASFLSGDYDEVDSDASNLGDSQEVVVVPPEVHPNRRRNKSRDDEAGGKRKKIMNNYEMHEEPQVDRVEVYNAAEAEADVVILEAKDELSIGTAEEAMRHLRALQEYAMVQDNFRAIGLLMQAEHALQYPPNAKDFEE